MCSSLIATVLQLQLLTVSMMMGAQLESCSVRPLSLHVTAVQCGHQQHRRKEEEEG